MNPDDEIAEIAALPVWKWREIAKKRERYVRKYCDPDRILGEWFVYATEICGHNVEGDACKTCFKILSVIYFEIRRLQEQGLMMLVNGRPIPTVESLKKLDSASKDLSDSWALLSRYLKKQKEADRFAVKQFREALKAVQKAVDELPRSPAIPDAGRERRTALVNHILEVRMEESEKRQMYYIIEEVYCRSYYTQEYLSLSLEDDMALSSRVAEIKNMYPGIDQRSAVLSIMSAVIDVVASNHPGTRISTDEELVGKAINYRVVCDFVVRCRHKAICIIESSRWGRTVTLGRTLLACDLLAEIHGLDTVYGIMVSSSGGCHFIRSTNEWVEEETVVRSGQVSGRLNAILTYD